MEYSFSISYVPSAANPGYSNLYVDTQRWTDGKCVTGVRLIGPMLIDLSDVLSEMESFEWASELADIAWHQIVTKANEVDREKRLSVVRDEDRIRPVP